MLAPSWNKNCNKVLIPFTYTTYIFQIQKIISSEVEEALVGTHRPLPMHESVKTKDQKKAEEEEKWNMMTSEVEEALEGTLHRPILREFGVLKIRRLWKHRGAL